MAHCRYKNIVFDTVASCDVAHCRNENILFDTVISYDVAAHTMLHMHGGCPAAADVAFGSPRCTTPSLHAMVPFCKTNTRECHSTAETGSTQYGT